MIKPFDPFNQCTEYYYRIEKLLADNTALKAENARLKTVPMKYRRMAFNAQLQDENHELHAQLAESQAREAKLREALTELSCLGNGNVPGNSIGNGIAQLALALPHDDTALREYRNAIIEECALELCNFEAGNLAYLIRKLKKEQYETS